MTTAWRREYTEDCIYDYICGDSVATIARRYGRSPWLVRAILGENGITIREKSPARPNMPPRKRRLKWVIIARPWHRISRNVKAARESGLA